MPKSRSKGSKGSKSRSRSKGNKGRSGSKSRSRSKGSRSRSRSKSRSGSRTRSSRPLGARRSPLGMRRTYRRASVDKSASKWRRRGLGYPMGSRSRKSWAQKAIKDAFRKYKKRKQAKRRSILATTRGTFGRLPNELGGLIRKFTIKKGGYKYGKNVSKKNRTKSNAASKKKTTKRRSKNGSKNKRR